MVLKLGVVFLNRRLLDTNPGAPETRRGFFMRIPTALVSTLLFCRNAAPLWFFYGLRPHLKREDIRCFVNVHRGRARERRFRLRCTAALRVPSPNQRSACHEETSYRRCRLGHCFLARVGSYRNCVARQGGWGLGPVLGGLDEIDTLTSDHHILQVMQHQGVTDAI